jgi:hypothetical protein
MEPSGRASRVLSDDFAVKGTRESNKTSAAASALGQIELSSARVVPVRWCSSSSPSRGRMAGLKPRTSRLITCCKATASSFSIALATS